MAVGIIRHRTDVRASFVFGLFLLISSIQAREGTPMINLNKSSSSIRYSPKPSPPVKSQYRDALDITHLEYFFCAYQIFGAQLIIA